MKTLGALCNADLCTLNITAALPFSRFFAYFSGFAKLNNNFRYIADQSPIKKRTPPKANRRTNEKEKGKSSAPDKRNKKKKASWFIIDQKLHVHDEAKVIGNGDCWHLPREVEHDDNPTVSDMMV